MEWVGCDKFQRDFPQYHGFRTPKISSLWQLAEGHCRALASWMMEGMFWAPRDSFQNNVNKNRGTSSELKCCDFINVMCFIVLSASSSGNVSSCLMLIQIGQHLRSMRESKRKRFFSPMAQIKVGFLSGVFRVSWARTRLFFGMDGLPPRSIRKKNSCRDTDEFEIV